MSTKSVLLVEDDATTARIYQSLFERHGYDVTMVADGSDAFMLAHHQHYDLLLLDLMLPNMDGLAMLRRLRAQRRFSHTPIFLYTSSELLQVEPLALDAGATRVFSKALPAKELVQSILDTLTSLQSSRARGPEESGEPNEAEVRRSRDFRVPGKGEEPKITLRMVDVPADPPPLPPTAITPSPPEIKVEIEEEKQGLLSRLFKNRPKDS